MHMICPSMPIPASTELTELLYISCHKNYCALPFCWRQRAYAPCPHPYPPLLVQPGAMQINELLCTSLMMNEFDFI